jgi:hypothetical protein
MRDLSRETFSAQPDRNRSTFFPKLAHEKGNATMMTYLAIALAITSGHVIGTDIPGGNSGVIDQAIILGSQSADPSEKLSRALIINQSIESGILNGAISRANIAGNASAISLEPTRRLAREWINLGLVGISGVISTEIIPQPPTKIGDAIVFPTIADIRV